MKRRQEYLDPEMQRALNESGIEPSKRKGQHFLRSKEIARLIVDSANIGPEDTILEIGPGLGILTFLIAEQAKKVIAIELEPSLCAFLEREAKIRGVDNLVVVQGDALSIDLPPFNKVISNLPYNISSPLTFRLLPMDFDLGVLMYQKELGMRFIMGPGTKRRGAPTFKADYYADIAELIKVPAREFHPVPAVDSLVVGIGKRPFPYELRDREFYFRVIDVLFQLRRRKLRNSLLLGFMKLPGASGMDKERFKAIMVACVPDDILEKRPEELEPAEMAGLANVLYDRLFDE